MNFYITAFPGIGAVALIAALVLGIIVLALVWIRLPGRETLAKTRAVVI